MALIDNNSSQPGPAESSAELQKIMTHRIPLAESAGIKVVTARKDLVELTGLLELNKNHHDTVFGGSISVILILTGWALVQEIMNEIDPSASIVIARQSVDYLRPLRGDFISRSTPPSSGDVQTLKESLKRKSSGKITVKADLFEQNNSQNDAKACASFEGLFVVKTDAHSAG